MEEIFLELGINNEYLEVEYFIFGLKGHAMKGGGRGNFWSDRGIVLKISSSHPWPWLH